MKVKVILHHGEYILNVENYNAVELKEELNNRDLFAIQIGDMVANKSSVVAIIPFDSNEELEVKGTTEFEVK